MMGPGKAWVPKFPTSASLDALVEPFRAGAHAFLESLRAEGAQVRVSATWRPRERAYLMHWSCLVATGGQDPREVPPLDGVDIDWTAGGDLARAKAGAAEMVKAYGIVYPPALASRHTQRLAFDATITIPPRPERLYRFKGGDGQVWMFGSQDLESLYRFGATFGCIKLRSDPPHWSSDGH